MKTHNPSQKVKVEMTLVQLILLQRMFNVNGKMVDEFKKTQMYGQMCGTGYTKGENLTSAANDAFEQDAFWHLFRQATPDSVDFLYPKFVPNIKIGEHAVEFKEDGVQVGCTFVDKKTILDIAERIK